MLRLIIVGGGFGGLALAKQLRSRSDVQITLLTERHDFRYCPALYRTATGFTMRASSIPIKDITKPLKNVEVIYGRAKHIDMNKHILTTGSGKSLHYDKVVLALGSVPDYFDTPGIKQNAFSVTSPDEILDLRKHLHDFMTTAHNSEHSYVVIGAGATGVEVSAGLASYVQKIAKKHKIKHPKVQIDLVDRSDKPLPNLPVSTSKHARLRLKRLGIRFWPKTNVKKETSKQLVTDKHLFDTNTAVWCAGAKLPSFYRQNNQWFGISKRGKILVDNYLKVHPDVFVIGDNADTANSGYAQTAVHDAGYVASQLQRQLKGKKLKKYKPRSPIVVVPVGNKWALLHYRGYSLRGITASVIRDLADLFGYLDIMQPKKAIKIWRARNDTEEYCAICLNNKTLKR
ncbi:MAG: FAD-dependent oxidoreductase [Candidatus Saccharibacteria bacterium]|nr:FAD-dependent oxidoreductase [Candidatus Saccharibacteria bacterium]